MIARACRLCMAVRAPGRVGWMWKIRRGVVARGPARALPSFSLPKSRADKHPRSVPLTSMIDVMVVLVVFMLLQFVAPDPCACLSRRVNLPFVDHPMDLVDAPLVSVTSDAIFVDGQPVASREDLAGNRVHRIDAMFTLLKGKHELSRTLAPGKDPPTHVILAIDASVPSHLVKSVTMTAAASGYPDIDFMVEAD